MTTIPTNSRTSIRLGNVAQDVEVQPWTVEFLVEAADPDLVRLYSVDGDPHLIIVETNDRQGTLQLVCYLGLHGTERQPAGTLDLEVQQGASLPESELIFDLR